MYKVQLNYSGELSDIDIDTEMPFIPAIGDNIGFWHEDTYLFTKVHLVVYEFNGSNKFKHIEIHITDNTD